MKKQSVFRLLSLVFLSLAMSQQAHAGDFLSRLVDWFNNYYNNPENGDLCYSQLNARTGLGAGKVYAEWATGKDYSNEYVDARAVIEVSVLSPEDNTAKKAKNVDYTDHKYVFFAVSEEGWEFENVYSDAEYQSVYTPVEHKEEEGHYAARVQIRTGALSRANQVVQNLYARFALNVTINKRGYSTLYYSNYNFKVPNGVEAITYKLGSDNKQLVESTRYRAGGVIPAGEAVVLQGAANTTYKFIPVKGNYTPDEANVLKGTDEAEETTGGTKYYALSYNSTKGVVGFYWMNEGGAAFINGAHKVYLALGGAASDVKGFDLEGDDATGIDNVNDNLNDGPIFNLAGQRVGKMQKGINIVNGKKIMVK